MASGLCRSHVGPGTMKDGTAEAWRDPHPTRTSPSAGQHPVQCSRKQNLWEKPAAQRAQHSLAVSHQPPGCLPHPAAVSVSVSLRATSSTSSRTTVLGTETKACWLLAFQAPSCLVTVVAPEGVSLDMAKVRLVNQIPGSVKWGQRWRVFKQNRAAIPIGNSIIWHK